jgi:hypothetical protein
MALPTIVLNNTTGSSIGLEQLAITLPAGGSGAVSDFDTPGEVLNDSELQVHLDSGAITITFDGDALSSEQSKSKIQPITALDIRHNLAAVVPPGVGDDDAAGYSVGSNWIDTVGESAFQCVDDTTGAATWVPSGSSAIPTGNTLWVDPINGDDVTAVSGSMATPGQFLTMAAALAAAAGGDTVIVRPGTYVESGLTVPADVSLVSEGGFLVTIVGDAAAVSHVITLSDGSYVQGFTVTVPTTASVAGVAHSAGTGIVYDLDFRGDGLTGSGDGIVKTGAGKVVGGNIRCSLGGMANLLRVSAAVLALDDVHVAQSAGAIGSVTLTEGAGRFEGQAHNVWNSNVGDCIRLAGTSTCIIYSPSWFNVPVGAHIAADGVAVTVIGGKIDATAQSLLIDPALTGAGTSITVSGATMQPLFSFPSAALGAMQLNATFHQTLTDTRNAESRVVGGDLVTGFPELGSGLVVGEGSSYSAGIKVITTDGTETMVGGVVTGGSQVDETEAAQSRSGSTLTFQGTGVGNAIYFASSRETTVGAALKHWAAKVTQVAAAVDGSYVMEIWDGLSWVGVGVQATSEVETYRYSSDVFLRAASDEFLQYGIDADTTWGLATADEAGAVIGPSYWVRWRIASTATALPTFETVWLSPSQLQINSLGRRRALGLALWREALIIGGNVFGESGGVFSGNIPVGSGGVPTGWTQNAPNSRMNNSGDAIYTQLILPNTICTAFPLRITPVYTVQGSQPVTSAPTGTVSVLPAEVVGVPVADPAGGIVPIPRARANADTLTANAGQAIGPRALTGLATTDNFALSTVFSSFDINGYYGGDLVLIRFEMDSDGTPNQDLTVLTLILEGVAFSDGGTL